MGGQSPHPFISVSPPGDQTIPLGRCFTLTVSAGWGEDGAHGVCGELGRDLQGGVRGQRPGGGLEPDGAQRRLRPLQLGLAEERAVHTGSRDQGVPNLCAL